jgi:hypothetical protein
MGWRDVVWMRVCGCVGEEKEKEASELTECMRVTLPDMMSCYAVAFNRHEG